MDYKLPRRSISFLIRLNPIQKTRPVNAAMHCAKSSHSPQLLVLQLHRQIRVAHQTLAQQVDAMPNVTQRMLLQRPLRPVPLLGLLCLIADHVRVLQDLVVEHVEAVPQLILQCTL